MYFEYLNPIQRIPRCPKPRLYHNSNKEKLGNYKTVSEIWEASSNLVWIVYAYIYIYTIQTELLFKSGLKLIKKIFYFLILLMLFIGYIYIYMFIPTNK